MSSKNIKKKGQFSSGEIIVAYFVFFMALVLAVMLWDQTTSDITASERLHDFEDIGATLSEKLVRTQGIPSNWTRDDVEVLGLADNPRELNQGKVLDFVYMMNGTEYADNKHLLGIGRYNMSFRLENLSGSLVELDGINCTTGVESVDADEQLTTTRTAILDEEIVRMKITIWYGG